MLAVVELTVLHLLQKQIVMKQRQLQEAMSETYIMQPTHNLGFINKKLLEGEEREREQKMHVQDLGK